MCGKFEGKKSFWEVSKPGGLIRDLNFRGLGQVTSILGDAQRLRMEEDRDFPCNTVDGWNAAITTCMYETLVNNGIFSISTG